MDNGVDEPFRGRILTSIPANRIVMLPIVLHERLVPAAILATAILVSVGIVVADTSTTSVTVGNSNPTVTAVSMNYGNNVTLVENSFVHATGTMTVTDANGCSTISSVQAKFAFATSVADMWGANCNYDANICYRAHSCTATTTGNSCTGGADTSAEYDCKFEIWYPARPTDGSSPGLTSASWFLSATATDSGAGTGHATNTGQTIEVNTLNALNVTGSIAFGTVSANSNTGASNQTVTHTNTGNTALDNAISGDVMCTDYPTCAGGAQGVMQPTQQKFDLIDQTYASLTNTLAATTSPATIEVVLATSTATTSAVTDLSYWGIAIPAGQTTGAYTGQNTVTATAD